MTDIETRITDNLEDGTDVLGSTPVVPEAKAEESTSGATTSVVNRAALIAERAALAGSGSGFAASRRRAIAKALGETVNYDSIEFVD